MIAATHCVMHGRRVFIFSAFSAKNNLALMGFIPAPTMPVRFQIVVRIEEVFSINVKISIET